MGFVLTLLVRMGYELTSIPLHHKDNWPAASAPDRTQSGTPIPR